MKYITHIPIFIIIVTLAAFALDIYQIYCGGIWAVISLVLFIIKVQALQIIIKNEFNSDKKSYERN